MEPKPVTSEDIKALVVAIREMDRSINSNLRDIAKALSRPQ